MPELVIAATIVVIVVISGLVVYLRSRQLMQQGPRTGNASQVAREETIDRSARTLKKILLQLADTIGRLDGATDQSATTLRDTRKKVDSIKTEGSMRGAQDSLLTAIDGLLVQNSKLREELRTSKTELASQQQEIDKLQTAARVDALTQVGNRKAFDERLVEAMNHFSRYNEAFCLLMLDIDHFKRINDTHGHVNGDRVLEGVARKLRASVRGSDFIGRYGGEEFGLILSKTTAPIGREIAEKIREGIEFSKFGLDGTELRVTVSAGVTEVTRNDTPESLVQRADGALYEAKNSGRNRVVLAGPEPSSR